MPQCFQKTTYPDPSKGVIVWEWVNPSLDDKISNWSKLKVFANDNLIVVKMIIYVLDREKTIVGKRNNAGYQHIPLFPQCFQKHPYPMSLKVGIVWVRINSLPHHPDF